MVTPLARQVINQILVPSEKRIIHDAAHIMYRMADIHCFEVSEVIEQANELVEKGGLNGLTVMAEAMCFLPAPKTWIEWKSSEIGRIGFLLEEIDNKTRAQVNIIVWNGDGITSLPEKFAMPLVGNKSIGTIITYPGMSDERANECGRLAAILVGALAFINTPRIIGRRQHMPNRGLEKKILKDRKSPSVFPLNAWTEVILHITEPMDVSNQESVEAHYTGQRARHFCRAHLRIQYGKIVVVRGHWRGDLSLGLVQTRYKLKP